MLSKILRSLSILAALTVAAQADGLVTDVKVRQQGDAVKIVIPANAAVQHRARTVDKSVVVDLFPAKLGSAVKADYAVNRGLVSKVHVHQVNESTVRVTADATSATSYKLTERPGGCGLTLLVSEAFPVQPREKLADDKLVTLNLTNTDLGYVVKLLVRKMGFQTFLGTEAVGNININVRGVPAETALDFVLKSQESDLSYKLAEPYTIVVSTREKLDISQDIVQNWPADVPKDAIRQEIVLEKAPAAQVMSSLERHYKGVKFTPHPTTNGFYITGSKRDVLDIKGNIPILDRAPDVWTREVFKITYGVRLKNQNLVEVKQLLSSLIPDIIYTVDEHNSRIILNGSAASIELALETIAELFGDYREDNWFTHSRDDQPRSSPP